MELVIRNYGKALVEIVIVGLLLSLLFVGIRDDAGNEGVFQMLGAQYIKLPVEKQTEYACYKREAEKTFPVISYVEAEALSIGTYKMADYMKAFDFKNDEVEIKVLDIFDERGRRVENCNLDTTEVTFERPGIYTVKVSAIDNANKRSVCQIRVPVNGERGGTI